VGESGNAYKAALMLNLSGCDWQPVFVDYHYYDEATTIDRHAFPNIAAWKQRIAALPGWKHLYELMPCGLQPTSG
jgi:glutathione S-transferase